MRYGDCPTCCKFACLDTYACPPEWNVRVADPDHDGYHLKVIRAHDAQEAAEEFVRWYDEHGTSYDLAGCGLSIDVVVWQSPAVSREGQAFTVTGHAVPKYTAQEKK